MEVRTAGELGYCFGVRQAIEKAIQYAEATEGKLYTLGTLAHNEHVVVYLREKGVEPMPFEAPHPDIELNANVAITAHGAPPEYYESLKSVTGNILDCTCPIVQRAQAVVSQQLDGFDILIFGDPNHQEVKSLVGWAEDKVKFVGGFNQLFTPEQEYKELDVGKKVAVISQTTQVPADYTDFLSSLLHRLQWPPAEGTHRLEELRVFNTICPIVATRIEETRNLADEVDIMLVVGSHFSANTRNLYRIARTEMIGRVYPGFIPYESAKVPVVLVHSEDDVALALTKSRELIPISWHMDEPEAELVVGVTAGTSTPIEVVEEVVNRVKEITDES